MKTWSAMTNEIHRDQRNHQDLFIAKVDCRSEKFSLFCQRYKVSHFPTLAWLKNGNIEGTYASKKISVESLKTFAYDMLNGHHYPPKNQPKPIHKGILHRESDISSNHYEVISPKQAKKPLHRHHPEHHPIDDANDAEEKTMEHSDESRNHIVNQKLHKIVNNDVKNMIMNYPRFIKHPIGHNMTNDFIEVLKPSKPAEKSVLQMLKDKVNGIFTSDFLHLSDGKDGRNIKMAEMKHHNEVQKKAHTMQMGYNNFRKLLDPNGITFVVFYGMNTTKLIHDDEMKLLKKNAQKYFKSDHALGEVNCGLKENEALCEHEKFIRDPMVNVYKNGHLTVHNLDITENFDAAFKLM